MAHTQYKLMPMEPTPEMVRAFQHGFSTQLGIRRSAHGRQKHPMSAEEAGLRAMLKHAPAASERLPAETLSRLRALEAAAQLLLLRYDELRDGETAPEMEALRNALGGGSPTGHQEEGHSGQCAGHAGTTRAEPLQYLQPQVVT